LIIRQITAQGGGAFWGIVLGILGPYNPLLAAVIVRSVISKEGYKDAHLGIKGIAWQISAGTKLWQMSFVS